MREVKEDRVKWGYYDEETEVGELLQGCNQKGVREKKLYEAIKKVQTSLKLKSQRQQDVDQEMDYQSFIFQNDDYKHYFLKAVWQGNKIPKKNNTYLSRNRHHLQKENTEPTPISVQLVTQKIQAIESLYSDVSLGLEREWNAIEVREDFIANIKQEQQLNHIVNLVLILEQGMSNPNQLTLKNEVKVTKLLNFKYWPSYESKTQWVKFMQTQAISNLYALYIGIRMLEKTNSTFVEKALVKKQKKTQRNPQDKQESNEIMKNKRNRPQITNYREHSDSEEEDKVNINEDYEDSNESQWDDECYICNQGGKVICCERCT